MIHGTMDRSSSFARAARRLPELRVLTYDRRGYGKSTGAAPADGPMAAHVEDLVGLLGGRSATVVGHSFGGDVAFALALSHPELTTAVAAFEPPMPWIPWWPEGGASRDIRRQDIVAPAAVAERFFRLVAVDEVWESLPERTKADRRREGPAVLSDIDTLTGRTPPFDVAQLSALETPIFLAAGEQSKPHQRLGTARLAQALGVPLTVITGARHGAHSSHPEEFARWVRNIVA